MRILEKLFYFSRFKLPGSERQSRSGAGAEKKDRQSIEGGAYSGSRVSVEVSVAGSETAGCGKSMEVSSQAVMRPWKYPGFSELFS